jgi:hypothetical protein
MQQHFHWQFIIDVKKDIVAFIHNAVENNFLAEFVQWIKKERIRLLFKRATRRIDAACS